jgi:AcrR family transcriptional regulator
MSIVSTPYEAGGRSAQKRRTRQALVDAARELIAAGAAPTVEEAAASASISRATAYRYFPNQRDLLVAAHPEVGARSMLPDGVTRDPAARLDAVVRSFTALILETEAQQRTMLRLSLESDPTDRGDLPLRQGRAIGWISEALDGLHGELSEDALRRLVFSIRATIGIESLVWLIDVAGLSRTEAVELMSWSAQALLQHARTGPPPAPAPPLPKAKAGARP